MKLTLNDIKRVTVGALQIWEDSNGVHFCKMTPNQLKAFSALSQSLYTNACANTGVRLDFWTDSPTLSYTPLMNGKYELKLDGFLTPYVTAKQNQPISLSLGDGKTSHRVTLHLPCHGPEAGIGCVELADGASLTPHTFDRKFLFIGDSITQGWNAKWNTLSYAYQVSDFFNAESIIQGTGGAYYDQSTIEKIDFDPDTVFVAYGTNDSNKFQTVEEIATRCQAFLKKLISLFPDAEIIVITPVWRIDWETPKAFGHLRLVNECIEKTATALGLRVIDGTRMIPADSTFMADNLHPNDLGFSLYAHNLCRALLR